MPSIMQRIGTPNARHNLDNAYRKHLKNVEPSLSKYNKIIAKRSVEEIYSEHLQPAFEEFNDQQTRKDRRLDVKYDCSTYLEYQRELDRRAKSSSNAIGKKGRPAIREIVWQIGNPEQGYGCLGQTDESRERIGEMLLECQKRAEARYPQLVWGDKSIHFDEVSEDADGKILGSIHMHSSFVPLCFENKQGPSVQVALERCLQEMGFDTFQDWKHDLDKLMEEVLRDYGLERTFMDNHEKHVNSREFHRQQKMLKQTRELEAEIDTMTKQGKEYIAQYRAERTELEGEITQLQDTKFVVLDELNAIIDRSAETIDELVEQTVASALENSNGTYDNALYYLAACSDEELDEISEKGYQLKKQTIGENIDADLVKKDLDQFISKIKASNLQISWDERQAFWSKYKELTGEFWEARPELANMLKVEISTEYDNRRAALRSFYDAQYLLRSTRNVFVMVYAAVKAFKAIDKQKAAEAKIEALKKERDDLSAKTATFKKYSNYYRDELKAGRRPCEAYLEQLTDIVSFVDEKTKEMPERSMPTDPGDR